MSRAQIRRIQLKAEARRLSIPMQMVIIHFLRAFDHVAVDEGFLGNFSLIFSFFGPTLIFLPAPGVCLADAGASARLPFGDSGNPLMSLVSDHSFYVPSIVEIIHVWLKVSKGSGGWGSMAGR